LSIPHSKLFIKEGLLVEMKSAGIVGTGLYVPEEIRTNE